MLLIPFFILGSALIFAFLQVLGVIHFSKSKMNWGYFVSVLLFMAILGYIGVQSDSSVTEKFWYLALLAIALWSNVIKFTLGLVQDREVTIYNRFEHMMTGLLAFYGLYLTHASSYFPVTFLAPWMSSLFIVLIVNMISVAQEIVELIVDLAVGKKYMIGPGVRDTNWDLLCTFLGSLAGFLLWMG